MHWGMSYLERQRAWQEEDERRREQWRKFQQGCEEHRERVLAAGNVSPWFLLAAVIVLLASSAYFIYGLRRGMREYRPPAAINSPVATPRGQPPQNNKPKRRAKKQATPANAERK